MGQIVLLFRLSHTWQTIFLLWRKNSTFWAEANSLQGQNKRAAPVNIPENAAHSVLSFWFFKFELFTSDSSIADQNVIIKDVLLHSSYLVADSLICSFLTFKNIFCINKIIFNSNKHQWNHFWYAKTFHFWNVIFSLFFAAFNSFLLKSAKKRSNKNTSPYGKHSALVKNIKRI